MMYNIIYTAAQLLTSIILFICRLYLKVSASYSLKVSDQNEKRIGSVPTFFSLFALIFVTFSKGKKL
jgi:hypothetical protein